MKITEIAIYAYDLPVNNGPYRMSHGEVFSLDTTLVRITTDTGLVGWGEACPVGPVYEQHHAAGDRAALAGMAQGLLGQDPTNLVRLHRRMNGLLNGHLYAKAAIDIAAHDLTGKHYGVRVADLLGGVETERVPSYYAVAVDEPDVVAERAAEKAAEGYPRLQVKVGGRPVELDIETIRKVWERVKDRGISLSADANRGLTVRDALRLSRECPDVPFILEQPCNTLDEVLALRNRVNHAIYLDEITTDLTKAVGALAKGQCDGFGMKVTRIGGLHPMAVVRDVCEAYSTPHTTDDSWGGDIIAAACAHLGATVRPGLNEGVWVAAPYIEGHYDTRGGISVEGGHIRLPEGPGLGLEIDESIFGAPVAVFG
ncbi:mandelate racemase [Mycobacterium dioxanotrophicus]|uniref:Mandelate racemase n=1 Tax=Mycobacterium dioxanotrophicus TaxID=482462 RepID=A0A1Y0C6E0_9MYCO|nr:mandelate racemase/muconate lactonizing enzyme family protein [Mycobacterium dioxanotrophicus]ART70790.1 mandelate racemase [Mycobacterium dioxanotrophicus]